jgi:hypothetical protein
VGWEGLGHQEKLGAIIIGALREFDAVEADLHTSKFEKPQSSVAVDWACKLLRSTSRSSVPPWPYLY